MQYHCCCRLMTRVCPDMSTRARARTHARAHTRTTQALARLTVSMKWEQTYSRVMVVFPALQVIPFKARALVHSKVAVVKSLLQIGRIPLLTRSALRSSRPWISARREPMSFTTIPCTQCHPQMYTARGMRACPMTPAVTRHVRIPAIQPSMYLPLDCTIYILHGTRSIYISSLFSVRATA
jgi:hypothetical protein